MKKILFDCGFRDATASLGLLALRVLIGLMMLIGHGIPKIQHYATLNKEFPVPDFFPLEHLPRSLSLLACIAGEAGAAALLILGLATRPAAFLLGFTMVVAAFNIHGAAPWFMGPGVPAAKEPALLYLIPMIAIILSGAGAFSLDALIYKDSKRRRW